MRRYFVDAWFFIALLDRFDGDHLAARRLESLFVGADLVTHDGVFTELLAYLSEYGPTIRRSAAEYVRDAMRTITVIPANRPLFLLGLALYERRPDKEYSLVDCMSMELMRQHGITHVLTNDHHFRQEGFTVLSDAP